MGFGALSGTLSGHTESRAVLKADVQPCREREASGLHGHADDPRHSIWFVGTSLVAADRPEGGSPAAEENACPPEP